MVEVIRADGSWLLHRRFCLFPGGELLREDALRRRINVLPPAGRGFMKLPHAMLLAVDGRRTIARMLTAVDADGNGYFSLFDALPDKQAVFDVLDEAVRWQQKNGGKTLLGPVAPDILDMEPGILTGGFEGEAAFGDRLNPPYYGKYLEEYGFSAESEWNTYRICTARIDAERYRTAAKWVGRRFDLWSYDLSRQPRKLAEVISVIMGSDAPAQEAVNRMVGMLQPFLTKGMCPAVFDKATGRAAGFLVAVGDGKRKPVRIANIWIGESRRRKGAALLLYDAVLQEALRRKHAEVDVSFIRSDNAASGMAVRAVDGRLIHRYCRYKLEI